VKIPIFAIVQEFAEVGEIGEERRVQGQGSIFGAHWEHHWSRWSVELGSVGLVGAMRG
jgi:hypothetical protein